MQRISIFERQCLRIIPRICCDNCVRIAEPKRRALGLRTQTIELARNLMKSAWLGHVLHVRIKRWPCCALFLEAYIIWNMGRGGQLMTSRKDMKTFISELSRVGRVKAPGLGPRNPRM